MSGRNPMPRIAYPPLHTEAVASSLVLPGHRSAFGDFMDVQKVDIMCGKLPNMAAPTVAELTYRF